MLYALLEQEPGGKSSWRGKQSYLVSLHKAWIHINGFGLLSGQSPVVCVELGEANLHPNVGL